MKWIDGHLDLAYIAVRGKNIYEPCKNPMHECISLPDLQESEVRTIFGTICTYPKSGPCGYEKSNNREGAYEAGIEQLHIYQQLEKEGHLFIQHTGCELSDSLSVLLLMEGADPIRTPEDVHWWREQGLRVVGLTWAIGTRYAGGNATGGPITEMGIDLVASLDAEKIVHDASHLSDEAFEGLLQHANGTIIASHSNSRTVLCSNSERHLRDDHAKEIFSRGGVIGLNLCNQFLSKDFSESNIEATIDDCVEHVMHFCELAGNKRQVALGSDFDGGFSPQYLPTNLQHPKDLGNLEVALKKAGFNEGDLASFKSGAWMRVFG
jgi:membrane dipeptidase